MMSATYNDYQNNPRQSAQLELPYPRDTLTPSLAPGSSLQRGSRLSRASNRSWISSGPRPPIRLTTPSPLAPISIPSTTPGSRGITEPYEQSGPEYGGYGPEIGYGHEVEHDDYDPSHLYGPEQELDPELDPENEYMTVAYDEEMGYGVGEPEKSKGRARHFVGGFVTGLRKIPRAMTKGVWHTRKPGEHSAMNVQDTVATENTLPRYDAPGQTIADPASVHYVSGVNMPTIPSRISETNHDPSLEPHDGQDSELAAAHHGSAILQSPAVGTPVQIDPELASDYDKMSSPVHIPMPDDSFSAHFSRMHNFVTTVRDLPWIASRVAADYVPAESSRARYALMKPEGSWYRTPTHQAIDLLSPAVPRATTTRRQGVESESRTRLRDPGSHVSLPRIASSSRGGRTPASPASGLPSPGASPHSHGRRTLPYNYYYPSPPQPLFVYASALSLGHAPSRDGSDSNSGHHEMRQAVPLYMLAGPPPYMVPPASPGQVHHATHRRQYPPGSPAHSHHSPEM